jgi:hypothetical protein
LDGLQGDVLVCSIGPNAPGALGGEPEQLLDGRSGLAAGAQLENLAEKDQGHDDSSRLEVHGDLAGFAAEGRWEDAGAESPEQAVAVGDAHSHPDECEHVEVSAANGSSSAHVEGPCSPEADRCGKRELEEDSSACGDPRGDGLAGEHVAHRDGDEGHRKGD